MVKLKAILEMGSTVCYNAQDLSTLPVYSPEQKGRIRRSSGTNSEGSECVCPV